MTTTYRIQIDHTACTTNPHHVLEKLVSDGSGGLRWKYVASGNEETIARIARRLTANGGLESETVRQFTVCDLEKTQTLPVVP